MAVVTRHINMLLSIFIIFISVSVRASVFKTDFMSQHVNSRSKRAEKQQNKLTKEDINTILQLHNGYRKKPGASNMEFMKWNSVLAGMAETTVSKCEFGHHHPEAGYKPFSRIGQNIWQGPDFDVKEAIRSWYNEGKNYNHENNSCSDVCRHYTQIVWSSTKEIGCALTYCENTTRNQLVDTHILVCNYGPAGNAVDQRPYKVGDACTKCPSGKGECYEGLCRDLSTDKVPGECKLKCFNCGSVDKKNCMCQCPRGWSGSDCTEKCEDKMSKCSKFEKTYCSQTSTFFSYMSNMCRAYCGICEPPMNSSKTCEPNQMSFPVNAPVHVVRTGNSCGKDGKSCSIGSSSYGKTNIGLILGLQTVVFTIVFTNIYRTCH